MEKDKEIEIIKSVQKTVAQMRVDDIEEYSDSAFEKFFCNCCGEDKESAGSLMYGDHRLCNDCVLFAEIGLALGRIKNIEDLFLSMENKRLENLCKFIKTDKTSTNN